MFVLRDNLRIRRFTPSAGRLLNLLPGDIGRPIGNIKLAVDVPDLEPLVAQVIETVQSVEREVRDRNGRWHALRIHPYRTADNKIDGAVVVLVDIHEAKGTGARLREAMEYARAVAETVREPLLVLDSGVRVRSANRAF
jgi:two-component system CheB/CheR fusion protein